MIPLWRRSDLVGVAFGIEGENASCGDTKDVCALVSREVTAFHESLGEEEKVSCER